MRPVHVVPFVLVTVCFDSGCKALKGDNTTPETGFESNAGWYDPRDEDQDGFWVDDMGSDEDCDDTNPQVFPGAEEVCNGIDDDCDEEVDEGCEDTGDTGDTATSALDWERLDWCAPERPARHRPMPSFVTTGPIRG